MVNLGMNKHQSGKSKSTSWITPREIIDELGPFDIDPCQCTPQPWPCADKGYTVNDNGLAQPWHGRVWLNPPYGVEARQWLERLAYHENGIALIFARTETVLFHEWIWNMADALFFFRGRISFYNPDGTLAKSNAGAPSVLVAYGEYNADRLRDCNLDGKYVDLNPRCPKCLRRLTPRPK